MATRYDLVSDQYGGAGIAAAPTGIDDTGTIMDAVRKQKRLQPGTYVYKGTGIDVADVILAGCGRNSTYLRIPDGVHLFDTTQRVTSTLLEGISFEGGAGVYRGRYTGVNTNWQQTIRSCTFYGWSEAAISHDSQDMPYWDISDNLFWPLDATRTIGVAVSGPGKIRGNNFLDAKAAIKVRPNGSNLRIYENDFIHQGPGTDRAYVWLVPQPNGHDEALAGVQIHSNKLGMENLDASDARILISDELAGATNGARLPNLAPSTGYAIGVSVHDNLASSGVTQPPLITSWTPELLGWAIDRNHFAGNPPSSIIGWKGAVPVDTVTGTVIGATTTDYPFNYSIPASSPATGCIAVDDPAGTVTGGAKRGRIITVYSSSAGTALPAVPASVAEVGGGAHRIKADMGSAREARITASIGTTASPGAKLGIQYCWSGDDQAQWQYLNGSDGPTVPIDQQGGVASAWIPLEYGARGDRWLRIVTLGGDGAAQPAVGIVTLQLS